VAPDAGTRAGDRVGVAAGLPRTVRSEASGFDHVIAVELEEDADGRLTGSPHRTRTCVAPRRRCADHFGCMRMPPSMRIDSAFM
jgi:hypothetical protein